MARVGVHALVSGRVQGVYYRQSTALHAERLALAGWVRNLADGRVEVWVEGEEAAVRELADWLWQGPERALVDGVELEEVVLQGFVDFCVRR
ncbi:acylphosphatase [Azotobacter beijerinckii]|uniref:acylphosphatase n=1 Tax=Azotobacter beijerinckii TaxID=170623 RepID=UPI00295411D1|nr:acylphosphatase [Azotobacter beijerinckii]MDV7210456.1 acylphosphatase [Azotobacter beijerinckii]